MTHPHIKFSTSLMALVAGLSWSSIVSAQQVPDTAPVPETGQAMSSDQANPPSPGPGATDGEDIVVTATKRETRLLDTPIAITALSQASLDEKGIRTARDLKGNVPNLQLGATADSGSFFSLRGVSSTDSTEVSEASVALHLDGFYSPRPQSALALIYDVERVEVLRGPQGTLFGMNSPGGTINIIPARPVFGEYSGKGEAEIGNYRSRQIRAALNFGLSDRLALRISGFVSKHDGMLRQGRDTTDASYTPSDKLLAETNEDGTPLVGVVAVPKDGIPDVDQRRNREVGRSDWYNNADTSGIRGIVRWKPVDEVETSLLVSHFENNGAGDINFTDCRQAEGTVNACRHPLRYVNINVPGSLHLTIDTYQLKMSGDVSDHMVLEYRGGIQLERRRQRVDNDAGNGPAAEWSSIGNPGPQVFADGTLNAPAITNYYAVADDSTNTDSSRYFSQTQELQLKSTGAGSFQYVVGAFLLHENKRIRYDQDSVESKSFGLLGDGTFQPDGLPYSTRYNQQKRTTTSRALFAQVDWRVIPKLGITAGYRQTWDKKGDLNGLTYYTGDDRNLWYRGLYTPTPGAIRAHQSNNLQPGMGIDAPLGVTVPLQSDPTDTTRSWKNGSFRLGMQYHASPDDMIYGSVSSGYKMGGFYELNDTCNNGCFSPLAYDPEYVTAYELGYKAKALDGALQFSLAGFLTKYRDIQQTGEFFVGVDQRQFYRDANGQLTIPNVNFGKDISAYTTVNLTNADIKGVELEFTAQPWAHGTFSGFATYLDAKVTKSGRFIDNYARDARAIYGQTPLNVIDENGITTQRFGDQTLLGKRLPFAPRFSISMNYRHEIDLGRVQLSPFVSARYQSRMWLDIQNYSGAHLGQYQDRYAKVDASVRASIDDERYFVEAFGENLTDIATKGFSNVSYGKVVAYYDTPRTYGVRIGARF
ncbi:Outer membrane receptor proteins, mostly Fe transport [Sphingomonas gellani]|uniref:Outer membrane receptor proteins, mostly Fe transport n=1 Tax=Sphingomonas gellani TaxID=1166340 RepID=A0A1H8AX05_9SPHN|nr:TonB-dependent receptor [Sphingomonas gellani]SEM75282.1 Outer membrane receptor proteins, mostly Fe transport [Sphingomonas gellani]